VSLPAPFLTPGGLASWLLEFFKQYGDQVYYIIAPVLAGLVRALGVTVESGQTALLFSFGRAGKTLDPGFHLLVPFLQRARKVPTRSRTLDLPTQRVVTHLGLVWIANANLVYRIVDVRRALIEIDDLERGMLQMLGLGVQEILRDLRRGETGGSRDLDGALLHNLQARLEAWGVEVERAGFTSITPSPRTLRLTQLAHIVAERRSRLGEFEARGVRRDWALSLMGSRVEVLKRSRALWQADRAHRRRRRLRSVLLRRGWTKVQLKQAGLRLRERITSGGRLHVPVRPPARPAAGTPARGRQGATERAGRQARSRVR
jgi:regulator of protease activity HflC (stomatin/prohibitin superfamily)